MKQSNSRLSTAATSFTNFAFAGMAFTGVAFASTAALAASPDSRSADNSPSNAELYEIIQAQQAEIEDMKNNNSQSGGASQVHIGGYGELHYNNIKDGDDEIDFHRFVLFFGYDFTKSIRFVSEFELEHALAGDGKPGEVELEQAYIEFDLNNNASVKGGVFLVPVGILNETHEPNTFYGVERNPVEKNIIPSTWWEAGAAFTGRTGIGLSYDIAVHSGLELNDGNGYKIRSGRQKVAEAKANDFAISGRLKYTGISGLEIAGSVVYQDDVTQENGNGDVSAALVEAHVIYASEYWGARALLANWSLSGEGPETFGRDEQRGGYVEGSFKPLKQLGLYARYTNWDNEAGNDADTDWNRFEVGVNYWPHENVVLKFDVYDQEQNDNTDESGFDLGIGYQF